MKIALKITPQRSTQYADMTAELAIPEMQASPLGALLQTLQPFTMAGQAYLLLEIVEDKVADALHTLLSVLIARMGSVSEAYEYFDHIGEMTGPLLRPIEPTFIPFVPLEMAEARRYKGKTNETFTRVLLNSALFAGAYRTQLNERLRILDPLCGGGTSLFLALAAGYDAFGIDRDRQDIETTAVFVGQYLQSERIHYTEIDEKGRRAGRRYQFEVGPKGNIYHRRFCAMVIPVRLRCICAKSLGDHICTRLWVICLMVSSTLARLLPCSTKRYLPGNNSCCLVVRWLLRGTLHVSSVLRC